LLPLVTNDPDAWSGLLIFVLVINVSARVEPGLGMCSVHHSVATPPPVYLHFIAELLSRRVGRGFS
jgi:hypothetical protein